jgi:NADPH:quinone reductase-like Zn-dependent oxidoreductase
MKATTRHPYGSAEHVLAGDEADMPVVGDGEALIQVHAAGGSVPRSGTPRSACRTWCG